MYLLRLSFDSVTWEGWQRLLIWHLPARNRRLGFLDSLGMIGLVGLLVARFIPVGKLPFWKCWLRASTGWPCLGCGLTRAADYLTHGHFLQAFQVNPLGALAYSLLAVLAVAMILHLVFAMPMPEVELTDKEASVVRWSLLVAVVLNYAYVVMQTRFPEYL